ETAAEEPRLVLMGDDGEKFGGWPTTAKLCWEDGWVDRFFTALEAEASWLGTVLPGPYAEAQRARGPVYLPAGSYPEMLRWSGDQRGRRLRRRRRLRTAPRVRVTERLPRSCPRRSGGRMGRPRPQCGRRNRPAPGALPRPAAAGRQGRAGLGAGGAAPGPRAG